MAVVDQPVYKNIREIKKNTHTHSNGKIIKRSYKKNK